MANFILVGLLILMGVIVVLDLKGVLKQNYRRPVKITYFIAVIIFLLILAGKLLD